MEAPERIPATAGGGVRGSEVDDLSALEAMSRYHEWKAALVRPHAGPRVIEAGCGTGSVLVRLGVLEKAVGIDRDEACIAAARERHAGRPGIEFETGDVTDAGFLSRAGMNPSSVLFVSSLEEIADPGLALRNAAAVLPAGGRVAVFASALPWIAGSLDRAYGQRRFGRRELTGLLEAAGFRVIEARYVNLLGVLAWIWDSGILRRSEPPASYAGRDLAVPVARVLDYLTGPPLGRSLLVAGEKTG